MSGWNDLDAFLSARGIRYGAPTLGQTTGGTHVDGSYHYLGLARDYGSSNSDMPAIIQAFRPYAVPGGPVVELFGPGVSIKNGAAIPQVAGHGDHVHVAIRAGATLGQAPPASSAPASSGGGGGGPLSAITAPLTALAGLSSAAVNPATWRRLGLVLAGSTLVALGAVILKRDLIESTAKTAAEVAAVV